jgi:hypothetical protein
MLADRRNGAPGDRTIELRRAKLSSTGTEMLSSNFRLSLGEYADAAAGAAEQRGGNFREPSRCSPRSRSTAKPS